MNNLKPANILEPGGGGGQCLSYRSLHAGEEGGPGGFLNLFKEEEQEEDEEEKKEDVDDE